MKAYAYAAILLALIGIGWGLHHLGGASCREKSANAAREHVEEQGRLLAQIEDAKQVREVIYRDKIRVVEKSTADCLDVRLPDDIRMQLPGGGKAE